MSDFSALNTALSGLLAHRRASEVIGHNLANVNTEGYSRQKVELTAASNGVIPAIFARSDKPGGGVDVTAQQRIRDEFMERRALTERGAGASLTRQTETMRRLELIVQEPSETGISSQLSEYWASWGDVVNQPDSVGARSQLLERGATLASTFNVAARELGQLRDDTVSGIEATVAEVNAIAARVAELNGAVRSAVAAGLQPNDLMDQRDLQVAKLAGLAGVATRAGEFGTVDVSIGGTALVRGDRAEELQVVELPVATPTAGDQPSQVGWSTVQVQWARDGYPASIGGGELHGMLATANDILPRHLAEIDKLATQLATQVNTVHATGFGLDGTTGHAFFAPPPAGTPPIGAAANLRLDAGMVGHPERIAASGTATPLGNLDVAIGQQLASMGESPTGIDEAYQAYVGRLGVESQTVQRRSAIQDEVTNQVDMSRLAVSAVNIDEEMIQLTQTQHAYSAAARLMTSIDSMIDTLINRTGLVGR